VSEVLEAAEASAEGSDFAVHLANFEGPFDLLLQLISKHHLDITEVALSQVTDDFLSHVKGLGPRFDLDRTTSFLVIAATLLDLKIVRLLPSARIDDEEDLALLEARDLLFARLLQYRAFKQVASSFERQMAKEAQQVPRSVGLDERFTAVLPDVLFAIGIDDFAALAAAALRPREAPELALEHMHAPKVSVRDQAAAIVDRLRRSRVTTFRALAADAADTVTTVARFLALLELFREGAVAFEQASPLGELSIRWTGTDEGDIAVEDDYDEQVVDEEPAESVTDADLERLRLEQTGREQSGPEQTRLEPTGVEQTGSQTS
jgi:segregation and condensation protein A